MPSPNPAQRRVDSSLVAFAIGMVLLLAIGLLLLSAIRRSATSTGEVERTYSALLALERVALASDQDVSAVRGFVLTGTEAFLATSQDARAQMREALTTFETLSAAEPEQLERLAALEALLDDRLALSDQYVAIRRTTDVAAATGLIPPGGEELRAGITAAIDELDAAERARLADQRAAAAAGDATVLATGAATGATGLLVLGLSFLALRRRASREALADARAHALLDAAPDALVVSDPEGRIHLVNGEAERVFGYTRDEMLGQPVDLLVPDARRASHEGDRFAYMKRPQVRRMGADLAGRRKDGTQFPAAIRLSPFSTPDGTYVTASVRDITERTRQERRLRDSEAQLRAAQEIGRIGSWTYDRATDTGVWSDEMYRITGRDPDRPPPPFGEHLTHLTPDSQARLRELAGRFGEHGEFEIELELVRPDGEHRWIVDRGRVVRDDATGGVRVMGTTQDVTEQRRLGEQLDQAQRVEAIGRLAAGVAHDFNNLLTPILGISAARIETLTADDPLREDLAEIVKASESAAALTRQLLAVGRRQVLRPEVLDINGIVQDVLRLLRRVLGEHIRVDIRLTPAIAPVSVDRGQMEQVLLNLAANARDAMPDGGTLTIETTAVELDGTAPRQRVELPPGAYISLAVRDTGHGMSADVRAHAFDAFYTTKEFGRGTGLGLATVYGIVQQSGGRIEVASEEGRGTEFRLLFPAAREAADPRPAPAAGTAAGRREAHGTVLLIEDNEGVRRFATDVLAAGGYTVLAAVSGEDALRLARDNPTPLRLVVTDVVLPDISGPAVAGRLATEHPGLKVLYMSGYPDDSFGPHHAIDVSVGFLAKPFTAEGLLDRVETALTDPDA